MIKYIILSILIISVFAEYKFSLYENGSVCLGDGNNQTMINISCNDNKPIFLDIDNFNNYCIGNIGINKCNFIIIDNYLDIKTKFIYGFVLGIIVMYFGIIITIKFNIIFY